MSITETVSATKAYTAQALDAEVGRRRNNKARDNKVRARSYVLPALSSADIAAIKAGNIVRVEFKSGRVEFVGLKNGV